MQLSLLLLKDAAIFVRFAIDVSQSLGYGNIASHWKRRSAIYAVMTALKLSLPASPTRSSSLESIGETYHETAARSCWRGRKGLTATYNRFHNPDERSADIQALRDLHRQMDEAVALAYGWHDLDLGARFL